MYHDLDVLAAELHPRDNGHAAGVAHLVPNDGALLAMQAKVAEDVVALSFLEDEPDLLRLQLVLDVIDGPLDLVAVLPHVELGHIFVAALQRGDNLIRLLIKYSWLRPANRLLLLQLPGIVLIASGDECL